MKDHPTAKPEKRGSFWKQVVEVFDFKRLKGSKNIKELLLNLSNIILPHLSLSVIRVF